MSASDDHSSLHAWMSSAGLSHLTARLLASGITEEVFPTLSLLDFEKFGITDLATRQKLFKLLQVVRTESEREKERIDLTNSVKSDKGHSLNGLYPTSTGTTSAQGFGLKSFFEARSMQQHNSPQRNQAATSAAERKYLSLPLKREILLSPPRTFEDSPAASPPRSTSSNSSNSTSNFQARPMSPANRSLLKNLSTYLPSESVSDVAPVALRAHHAWQPPATNSVQGSPVRASASSVPTSYQGRMSIPASPIRASQLSSAVNSVSQSPISPRAALALQAAHAALERERERTRLSQQAARDREALVRQLEEEKESFPPRPRQAFAGVSIVAPSNSFSTSPSSSSSHHHRNLFPDQVEGVVATGTSAAKLFAERSQVAAVLHPHIVGSPSASPSRYNNAPAPSSSSMIMHHAPQQQLGSLHPLEAGDFLADDADLGALGDVGLDEIEAEEEVGDDDDEEFESQEEGSYARGYSIPSANNAVAPSSSKIRVVVRKRPLNAKERSKGELNVVSVNEPTSTVVVHEPKTRVDLTKFEATHTFHFDATFNEDASNYNIYARTCQPLVGFMMAGKGERVSCFAYGQTGSGKTHTLVGPEGGKGEQSGLYVLAAQDIFSTLKQRQKEEVEQLQALRREKGAHAVPDGPSHELRFMHCSIYVSFFEIYSGKLFDLLKNRHKLVCRCDANGIVHTIGLHEKKVKDVKELMTLITEGNKLRSMGATGANIDSSRSHAILSISLKQIVPNTKNAVAGYRASVASNPSAGGANKNQLKLKTMGSFSFIDLAGSERAADTANNDRRTRLEGAEINKSLLALKECIRALDQGSAHTPFRGSILTQCLKCVAFTGNSRTVMIANISPNSASCEHTLNSLRYADRVKQLKKGVVQPLPSSLPPPTSSASSNSSASASANSSHLTSSVSAPNLSFVSNSNAGPAGPKSARGGKEVNAVAHAGNEAYMPHQGQARNVKYSKVNTSLAPPTTSNLHEQQPQSPPRKSPSKAAMMQASYNARPDSISPPTAAVHATSSSSSNVHPTSANGGHAGSTSDPLVTHHDLCARILTEEDALVQAHRISIDTRMAALKHEMELLRHFDSLGCSVDDYVKQLDLTCMQQQQGLTDLRSRIRVFDQHLKEEEMLSSTFKRKS